MSGIATSETVPNAQAYQAILPGVNQQIAIGASSVQSAQFQPKTSVIRLFATSDCFIAIGANPTADNTGMFLPAGCIEYFGVREDPSPKLAVIQSTAAGNLYITEGA